MTRIARHKPGDTVRIVASRPFRSETLAVKEVLTRNASAE